MQDLVQRLRGRYVAFRVVDSNKEEEIKNSAPSPEKRDRLLAQLGSQSSAEDRYRLEYDNGLYRSYKPGVDDDLDTLVGLQVNRAVVVEIGGGPAYLAAHAARGICADITRHPRLEEVGVEFVPADICQYETVGRVLKHIGDDSRPTVVAMSYCLDRVPDQRKALANFARLIRARRHAVGVITVCLPAVPSSPGVEGLNYSGGEWVTKGHDALVDYELIVRACQDEGLRFRSGGLTTHFGVSLDGYESLPCYVMVFGLA